MDKKIKNAFINAKFEPDTDLADTIWQKIIIRNSRIALIKTGIFSTFGILSIFGLIPISRALFTEFTQSGFYEYMSLLFTANSGITSYWRELSYSLAESLPLANIIYSLLLIFIFFISLRYVIIQIIKGQLYYNFN